MSCSFPCPRWSRVGEPERSVAANQGGGGRLRGVRGDGIQAPRRHFLVSGVPFRTSGGECVSCDIIPFKREVMETW